MPLIGDTGPHLDSWEDGSGGLSQEGVASRRLLQQDREGELVWRRGGGGGGGGVEMSWGGLELSPTHLPYWMDGGRNSRDG